MLKCQDIVVVKDAKGRLVAAKEYERTYYTHASGDPVETADVTVGGVKIGSKVRPTDKSTADPEALFSAMVEILQAESPGENPLRIILGRVQASQDLAARAVIRAPLLPQKPVDLDKALHKNAKYLMQLDPSLDLATAIAKIKSLLPAA